MPSVSVIGAGFSGLSAAACLAKDGYDVTVFEKLDQPGGRARQLKDQGFVFDMGPSWYWMPDVFEKFFNIFGKKPTDFYELKRLDPSYRIFFSQDDIMDVPAGEEALCRMFEQREPGSGRHLKEYLDESKYKYQVGIEKLVYKPGISLTELIDFDIARGLFKLDLLNSLSKSIRKRFKNDQLIQLLEFPALFLGATAADTPALYSLMNFADMCLGTWYPMGGLYRIVEAMHQTAVEQGVKFVFNSEVTAIEVEKERIKAMRINGRSLPSDFVVAAADYHHVEQHLLPNSFRKYSSQYWSERKMAPSALIYYIGINKKVNNLIHHNLFFDRSFEDHANEIYKNPRWPGDPLMYVCCPSKTDPTVAPVGCENIFILVPVASGLKDSDSIREDYFQRIINRLEIATGESIRNNIVYKKTYAHNDFVRDYHAFKGNAYGLANTLSQTANLKPSMVNKRVKNLFYTGQLTVPGPGVPPAIISGQVVSRTLRAYDAKARAKN